MQYPDTWAPLQSMMDTQEIELVAGSAEYSAIQQLLSATIAPLHKHNTNNHLLSISDLQLTRVVRVQNPILWVNYHNRSAKLKSALEVVSFMFRVGRGRGYR